ncbi:MAG: hypothetical protein OEQ28_11990 [Acidobacteriota bacterium]|nr:hypothetical protein [Acidobacteriota bacterium]
MILSLFISIGFGQNGLLVTAGSAGPIKIGMTVAEAKTAMPNFEFKRTSDGDGVALVAVSKGDTIQMTLYAGEEDPESAVNLGGVIEQIEVWTDGYQTVDGVGPGTLLSDAAAKYGGIKEIMVSEIEARQYVEFVNGPKDIGFRIDYSGIFADNERTTKRYEKGAKILSVIIQGDGTETNVGFFSEYTDLGKDCRTPEGQGEEGGHVSTYCDGPGDYRVHMYDTAMTLEITVESTVSRNNISVARESLSFKPQGRMLEWRFKKGEPFAVILRGNKYRQDENGQIKYPAEVTGEYLFVRGLPGFESINADVNVRTTKFANEEARKIAAEGYVKLKSPSRESVLINTSDYNLMIIKAAAAAESWVKSPMQVALRLVGDFQEMKMRKMVFDAPTGDGFDSFKLTVVSDGLLDDSIRAERLDFELIREANGIWQVSSAKKSWKCWQGRGHQDFSAVPCV